ncbi:MAG TPA: TetR/AcrR family transcriptional regulator, partial [Solirubrobacteraceae bacterium]
MSSSDPTRRRSGAPGGQKGIARRGADTPRRIGDRKGSARRGADTRRRIEAAAGRLFTIHGYTATTMQAIATEAGVHVQTIYLAYGTKPTLLAASAARLVAGDEDPATHPGERRWAREVAAEPDPRAKLARYVKQIGDVSPRITPLIDVLRATAPAEPDVAAFLAEMEQGRREGPRQLLGLGVPAGTWRPDLTPDKVADIVFAIASPDTLRALIDRCG